MANREDNLKKINAELEKLSDEQLEQVAGGFCDVPSQLNTNELATIFQGGAEKYQKCGSSSSTIK